MHPDCAPVPAFSPSLSGRHVIRSADRRTAIEAADLSEAIDRISQGPCAVPHGVVEEEKDRRHVNFSARVGIANA
ncbi:hypothetical protein EJ072_22100 [Mesorhizobium sp. M2A.F.Ca.ET.046.03.2.1]|nr:hypothetical protein EJ072_22100 [Mesorhizobium sp. M2A.F.Ca.ET.046.03.2.1]